ncbi:MAG: hypothetical protein QOJ07_3329, partial [Thermoleophilaceae bacterium]|nr:hypothetical protein [Thermoleophilaceae bacterium]
MVQAVGVRTRVALALAVGLALADASVVVLALPPILSELHTTVQGVAAVIGVYTLVLAAALPAAEVLRRRSGTALVGMLGWSVFALTAIGCAVAKDLTLLLV